MDTNKKLPSQHAKDQTEKTLGSWVSNQKKNYNAEGACFSKERMKNDELWQVWTDTLADPRYKEFLVLDPVEDWKNKHCKACEFIDTNKKLPSQHAKDQSEKTLGRWVSTQKTNYNSEGASSSKCIMKTNPEIWQIWKDTITDPRYKEFLVLDPVEDWKNKHAQMCEFMDTNHRAPSGSAKDPTEKKLGSWIGKQKTNFNAEGASSSKNIMENEEIWQIWTDTLADPRYKEFLVLDPVEDWKNKHCEAFEFMDTNHRTPSHHAKDPT
jgi:hypothetical protein